MSSPPQVGRSAALDGMRALLCAVVVAGHYGFGGLQSGGQPRVVVFYALSGFLVTTLVVSHVQQGRGHGDFWVARGARLIPAALVAIVIAVVSRVFSLVASGGEADPEAMELATGTWQAFGQVLNLQLASGGRAAEELMPMWSLSIEIQFLLVWAVAAFFLLRARLTWLLLSIAIAAAALSFGWALWLTTSDGFSDRVAFATDTRCGPLFLGAAVALVLPRADGARVYLVRYGRPIGLLCAATTLLMFSALVPSSFVTGWGQLLLASCGVLGTAVLWVTPVGSLSAATLGVPVLRWIGQRAYGIFLFHMPVLCLLGGHQDANVVLALALTVALAAVSWRYFETPVRDHFNAMRQPRAVPSDIQDSCRALSF